MGDVGGYELGMCKEVSWEEVVKVLKSMRKGNAPCPDGILNGMVIYGGRRLVEVMLQVMNLVLRSDPVQQTGRRACWCLSIG